MINILENKNEISKLKWVKMANDSAVRLNELNTEEILKKTVYFRFDQASELLNTISISNGNLFTGKGLELGSGVGLFSTLFSNFKEVEEIYSLEILESYVTLLQPKIINKYGDKNKVISTLGNYENLSYFEDNYFDFIFQYDAFHHANNLPKVLNECQRVLKKNGKIISIDRVQSDRITDKMIKRKLNIKYSKEYFVSHCKEYLENYTRQDNGEHEIRRSEWINHFKNSNFRNIIITNYINYSPKALVKLIISYLPDFILSKTRFKYLVGERFLPYIDGFFRENKPSNQGKFINLKEKKTHKDLAVLICEK